MIRALCVVLALAGCRTLPRARRGQAEAPSAREMEAARVDYRYINYPGAVHAFTNPAATEAGKKFNLPLAYQPEADKQSKDEMRKFLGEVFGAR